MRRTIDDKDGATQEVGRKMHITAWEVERSLTVSL
jgi:hypothetical protein